MKQNVILIVIDALRARNLGCYGYSKNTSLNIDKLADEGILFKNAFSTTNATDSSITSLFSGKYPLSHGINTHAEQVTKDIVHKFEKSGIKFLQEILKKRGYKTVSIDYLNRWYKRGFDKCLPNTTESISILENILMKFFDNSPLKIKLSMIKFQNKIFKNGIVKGEKFTDIAVRNIIDFAKIKEPFFLFIHYWDVHLPYDPPKNFLKFFSEQEYNQKLELKKIINKINGIWGSRLKIFTENLKTTNEMLARYDACIKYVDQQIGKIIDTLKQYHIFDDTIIIITSDHGESLVEHGIYFDHHGLYDESIHVPLIIKLPKKMFSNRIDAFVQHIDIVPTILDTINIPFKDNFDGVSLLPMINNGVDIRDFIFAEESYTQKKKCIRTKEYKYISSETKMDAICRYCGITHGGNEELYNLINDPKETKNILSEKPEIVKELKNKLISFIDYLIDKKLNEEKNKINNIIKKLKETKKF